MTKISAYNDTERREHNRIKYNLHQRPFLKIRNHELEVADISEGGFRIINIPNMMIFDEPFIRGTIILLCGQNIDLEAYKAWHKSGENGLKFKNLVPSVTIRKEREKFFDILIEQINSLPTDWHLVGSVSRKVLQAIVIYARKNNRSVENSVETGSGKTTLLFSHLSNNHVVFALENGSKSISAVKNSELFNAENVTYIEGPTQKTLPRYVFKHKFDLALIDGPHGYPFPDLEYFYFYSNIIEGGLLLIDDIQIPSIKRMFEIIKADDMFKLLKVVDNMAFFRRTDSPPIDPYSDNWWLQGYNRLHFEAIHGLTLRKNIIYKALKVITPEAVKNHIPKSLNYRTKKILTKLLKYTLK